MFIPLIITLSGGFLTWYLNERSKRIYEEYKRKEEKYTELIKNIRGFYADSINKELKQEFLKQLDLSWLYCPDEVIRKIYSFLLMLDKDRKSSEEERNEATGELILTIRKDLINRKPLSKTELTSKDFKILKAINN
ncbi:MAG: hypothetical protein Q8O30_05825 [Candidatus Omnitrophota bacterium]|nr:hypothetical protein [Candidatus Omnitrophota bacterium]